MMLLGIGVYKSSRYCQKEGKEIPNTSHYSSLHKTVLEKTGSTSSNTIVTFLPESCTSSLVGESSELRSTFIGFVQRSWDSETS